MRFKYFIYSIFFICFFNSKTAEPALSESFELLPLNEEVDSFIDVVNKLLLDLDNVKNEEQTIVNLEFLNNYIILQNKLTEYKNKIQENANEDLINKIPELEKIENELKTKINNPDAFWQKGKIIFNSLSNQIIEMYKNYNSERYLSDIINLIWYFYYLSALKNKTFEEGTFLINSSKADLIFKFLISYPEKYARISSHFPEMEIQQYGIDIPEVKRDVYVFPPFMKFHILFGKTGDDEIFIKPEDHGIGNIKDFLHHSVSYINSLHRRFIGSEQLESRKERIPEAIQKSWKKLVNVLISENNPALPPDFPKIDLNLIKFYEQFGIRGMVRFIKSSFMEDSILTPNQLNYKNLFIEQLKEFENLDLRRGNEVILTDQDFGISEAEEQKEQEESEELEYQRRENQRRELERKEYIKSEVERRKKDIEKYNQLENQIRETERLEFEKKQNELRELQKQEYLERREKERLAYERAENERREREKLAYEQAENQRRQRERQNFEREQNELREAQKQEYLKSENERRQRDIERHNQLENQRRQTDRQNFEREQNALRELQRREYEQNERERRERQELEYQRIENERRELERQEFEREQSNLRRERQREYELNERQRRLAEQLSYDQFQQQERARSERERLNFPPNRNLKLFKEVNDPLEYSYEGLIEKFLNEINNPRFARNILQALQEIAYTQEGYANQYEFIKQFLINKGYSQQQLRELIANF